MTIPILVALSGVLASGDVVASPGGTPTSSSSVTVLAPAPMGLGVTPAPDATSPARMTTAPTCAARVVPADPSVDPTMAVPAPPHLDRRMAVRGRCTVDTAPARRRR